MNDLIFVSMENWDDIWRRNQFICAELIRRYPEMKILFVGLSRDVSHHLQRGDLSPFTKMQGLTTVAEYPQISVFRPFKYLPNSIPAARVLNEVFTRQQIKSTAKRIGIRSAPLLWLNPHYAVHMVGQLNESAVIYDITDDWTQLTQSEVLKQLVIEQDAQLCQKADAVIVCSEKLYSLKQSMAKRLHLIPNGVDAGHYRSAKDTTIPLPEVARHWNHPVLGYTGTLHPDRVDIKLIEFLASRYPNGTIALVGPDYLTKGNHADLSKYKNVVCTGPVPYREIPDYMRAFDVCITPHMVTSFTESLNPIKLWEYLAAGKPIVSTNVAGFRDYPQFVHIANTYQEFSDAIEKALKEDSALSEQRRMEAQKNSWESRVDMIEQIIQACDPTPSSGNVNRKEKTSNAY